MTDAASPTPAPSPPPAPPAAPETSRFAYPFLAQSWWAVGLRGALAILFGLIAFVAPGATILSLILVFAAYVIVDGVLAIIAAVRAARKQERWGLLFLEGVVDLLMGIAALVLPGAAAFAFVFLLAFWALLTGGLMIGAAIRMDPAHGRWWLVASGVASVLFGVMVLIAPLVSLVVVTWWLGAYAVVFGAGLMMLAFRLRNRATAAA